MKTCMKCGYVNPDDASFCVNCGENVNTFVSGDNSYIPTGEGSELTADEAAVIDGMKRNLTREKKAFKIVSIIGIAVGSFFTVSLIFSLIIFTIVIAAAKPETTSNIAGLYMVCIFAGEPAYMKRTFRVSCKGEPEFLYEFGVKIAHLFTREITEEHKTAPARKIYRSENESFVHRQKNIAVTANAALVAERL